MERNQEAIEKHSAELFQRLEHVLEPFQTHMQFSGVVNSEELSVVNVELTPRAKLF